MVGEGECEADCPAETDGVPENDKDGDADKNLVLDAVAVTLAEVDLKRVRLEEPEQVIEREFVGDCDAVNDHDFFGEIVRERLVEELHVKELPTENVRLGDEDSLWDDNDRDRLWDCECDAVEVRDIVFDNVWPDDFEAETDSLRLSEYVNVSRAEML